MKDCVRSVGRFRVGWFPGVDGLCRMVFCILCKMIDG